MSISEEPGICVIYAICIASIVFFIAYEPYTCSSLFSAMPLHYSYLNLVYLNTCCMICKEHSQSPSHCEQLNK